MRIVVTGGESSGRSTLAEGLARALQLPIVPSLKDEVLRDSGYHTLYEWGATTRGWHDLVTRQLAREAAAADAIVVEGSLDLFCLTQRWFWNQLSPERVEPLYEAVVTQLRRCDRILVTPAALVGGASPHTFRNALHNQQLHRLAAALLDDAGLRARVTQLEAGEAPALLEQALQVLR